jgi:hypothetical protein
VPTTLEVRPRWLYFLCLCGVLFLTTAGLAPSSLAQSESASVSGRITDQQNGVIPNAEVEMRNVDTNSTHVTKTNGEGIYSFASLRPGNYVISVRKEQFQTVSVTGVILNVQDNLSRNFVLQVGSSAVSVTVNANDSHINTTDASVSTVVDRQFAENLPMNGRSFQTLIQLTPGVVPTVTNGADQGQFSVNGQRASANYWTIDGVSANVSASSSAAAGNGLAGAVGGYSALGGTNSLVSVDALQEFRIQTSTFAPEFGRTPGAQISIVTRSGENAFHGSAFDYLRNDVLDANNWFADENRLHKPEERQNDFGGTFSGAILKDRTFFFFSYEGLRLRLPQTVLADVPDLASRQSAAPALQPYLKAFPLPNGPEVGDGAALETASFSNSSSLNAYSVRLDHRWNTKLSFFGRYTYSPSDILQRGGGSALNNLTAIKDLTHTETLGSTWMISPRFLNDLRVNYSRAFAESSSSLDSFGGAVPISPLPFPTPTPPAALFSLDLFLLMHGGLATGPNGRNIQRQVNLVDTGSAEFGPHVVKFGADWRRLSPSMSTANYSESAFFPDVPSLTAGISNTVLTETSIPSKLLFQNLSFFAQDTWRTTRNLTITYGLRWDQDTTPKTANGPPLPAFTNFNLQNISQLALAPAGTPVYPSPSGWAPRIGAAYSPWHRPGYATVLRGGFGLFYDLATADAGSVFVPNFYPFAGNQFFAGATFPLTPSQLMPPPIVRPGPNAFVEVNAFDPHIKLPYTLQWNSAVEQELGSIGVFSVTYVGSAGRRLVQQAQIFGGNQNLPIIVFIANTGISDYDALQLQFHRRLTHGLQILASYSWSHSIDTASTAAGLDLSSLVASPLDLSGNRGPSSFDIRNAFSSAMTYEVPVINSLPGFAKFVTQGWSLDSIVQARSAPPVNVADADFSGFPFAGGFAGDVRPDLTGQPLYLYGSQFPGGKAFNPAAFTDPPIVVVNGIPVVEQGDVPRNFLRGFDAVQWDFAVHRKFPLHESMGLEFRAEMFNLLNHPNFASPPAMFGQLGFGVSNQTLNEGLSPSFAGTGGFSSLYQLGGPRSIQLALKLSF